MLTETTGPALATDHLARSVQAMRDACAPSTRGGWRDALGAITGADAMRAAVVALLDALLRLLHEFVAAGAAGAGLDMLPADPEHRAAPPSDPVHAAAAAALNARRGRRRFASRVTPSFVPTQAAPLLAPSRRQSSEPHPPRACRSRVRLGPASPQRARYRRVPWKRCRFRLRA